MASAEFDDLIVFPADIPEPINQTKRDLISQVLRDPRLIRVLPKGSRYLFELARSVKYFQWIRRARSTARTRETGLQSIGPPADQTERSSILRQSCDRRVLDWRFH